MIVPDWIRKGRQGVDLTNVTAKKLQEAYEKRGIEVDTTKSEPGKRIATINKIVVKGDGPFTPALDAGIKDCHYRQ